VYNSRKIEARTYEDVAFRYLSADTHPDHDTFAEFLSLPFRHFRF
jgi:transposase